MLIKFEITLALICDILIGRESTPRQRQEMVPFQTCNNSEILRSDKNDNGSVSFSNIEQKWICRWIRVRTDWGFSIT